MGISKKGRRKITYNNRIFYWKVLPEFSGDGDMLSLSIVSEDKKFNIKYFVVQNAPDDEHKIEIIGKEFLKLKAKNNRTKFSCPEFIPKEKKYVGPKDVESVLKWCFDEASK